MERESKLYIDENEEKEREREKGLEMSTGLKVREESVRYAGDELSSREGGGPWKG